MITLTAEKYVLIFNQNSHLAACDCCLNSCRCASLRRGWLCLPYTPCQEAEILPASPCQCCTNACNPLGYPGLHGLWHGMVQLVLGSPELDTGLQVLCHKCQMDRRDHSSLRAGYTLANTVQFAAGRLHCKGKLPTFSWLNLRIPGQHIPMYSSLNILSQSIIRHTKIHFVSNCVV